MQSIQTAVRHASTHELTAQLDAYERDPYNDWAFDVVGKELKPAIERELTRRKRFEPRD